MADFEAPVPLYYTVKPAASPEEVGAAIEALKLTPLACAIAFSVHDIETARQLSDDVMQFHERDAAYEAACLASMPVVIISGEDTLAAYYPDGSRLRII
jgi:hypothetical protein